MSLPPHFFSEAALVFSSVWFALFAVMALFRRVPLLLLLCSALAAFAAPAHAQRGGALSSFNVLEMEASTRAAAMGGAFSAVPDGDAGALFYNPALPNEQSHNALSAHYVNHLQGINAGFLAYSRRVEGVGAAGAGLRFFSYGELEGRDEQGYETGDFGASDMALTLGLSRALTERLRVGANVHAIYGSLEATGATALATDLGVVYRLAEQQFTMSASLNEWGWVADPYVGDDGTALPMDLRLGLSKKLAHLPLRLSATGFNLHDLGEGPDGASSFDQVMRHLALGAELTPVEVLALRVGYSHRRQEELATGDRRVDPAGLSAGFGITISPVSVDYAFSSWSALGGLHQFGLRVRV
jgi:hypothetical protein